MTIRINNLLPLVIMLILAGLTLWLRQAAEHPADTAATGADGQPDAVVDNFTLQRLNASGLAQYVLSARRMLHFSASDSTVLESPRFVKRDDDGVTMTVTANRGTIARQANAASFNGNVLLNRSAPAGREQLQVRTEYLQVLPDKEIARTDRYVTITQGGSTLSGVGLEINKSKQQISLQSQVKGSYRVARRN